MIEIETTQRTILVMCTSCGAREIMSFTAGRSAAYRWAEDHLERAHASATQQRRQVGQARWTHQTRRGR